MQPRQMRETFRPLLFDDLFDFHAGLLPKIGIPKLGGEAILAAIVAHWVIRNWHEIRRTRVQLLTAAIFACSASIVIDFLVNPSGSDRSLVFEDGAKFLGILAWATFFVVTTRDISRSVLRQVADDGVPDPTLVQSPRIDPATRHRPSTGSVGRPLSIG